MVLQEVLGYLNLHWGQPRGLRRLTSLRLSRTTVVETVEEIEVAIVRDGDPRGCSANVRDGPPSRANPLGLFIAI